MYSDCSHGIDTLPTGYYSSNCSNAHPYASFSTCAVTCDGARGYEGVARGEAVCFDGQWYASYSGCSRQCVLPSSVCTPGVGVKANYSAVSLFADQTVEKQTCAFRTKGHLGLFHLACAAGYTSDSSAGAHGAVACVEGTLLGGFVAHGVPKCQLKADQPEKDCSCGISGAIAKTSSKLVNGLLRSPPPAAGVNDWTCDRVGNFVTCNCVCK
jgi:hypothetical protein